MRFPDQCDRSFRWKVTDFGLAPGICGHDPPGMIRAGSALDPSPLAKLPDFYLRGADASPAECHAQNQTLSSFEWVMRPEAARFSR